MMILSLVAMTELEKCCITSAYLQWLCHSGERPVARRPLVIFDSDFALISCPLCNLNSLWNILMILGRNVEEDKTTCGVQE